MQTRSLHSWILLASTALALAGFTPQIVSQSQASNGQIEGIVTDIGGAAVEGAHIKVVNLGTGTTRLAVTDRGGTYRFSLLPLGAYEVSAEADGFKQSVRTGINVGTGQTVTVEIVFPPGDIEENVVISGDPPVTDIAKTDLGRLMENREFHNIPLATRNPYNFVLLQSNVTGRPNRSFNYPQINVNGFLRRVYYLLDGNNNTRGEIAGAPLLFISTEYVREMQLLTPSFSAEFGNTTGMVVNMITASGTNELHGSGTYLFSRPSFYARPFFFSEQVLPDSEMKNITASVGGPAVRDRWHYYFGYEWLRRVDSTRGNRQSNIKDADRLRLIEAGLPPSIFVAGVPVLERVAFNIFRTDVQINSSNHLSGRFNHSGIDVENQNAGGLNTSERGLDVITSDNALGVQLVSFTSKVFNEFRFQLAGVNIRNTLNTRAGIGPGVTITNVASFGSPQSTDTVNATNYSQIQNNFTWNNGEHSIKVGSGFLFRYATNLASRSAQYTFPSIDAYIAGRTAIDQYSYSQYQESFGDPETRVTSTSWNFFVQDDWKANRRLKLSYGVRYDIYSVPKADPDAPLPASRKFSIDTNNVAPRLAIAYSLRDGTRPLILRVGAGIYFEPPWIGMYTKALLSNGAPKFFNLRFCGNNGGSGCPRDTLAPAFPGTFSGSQPSGSILPQQSIVTIASDIENMYAIHSNVQVEQALTDDLSLAVGYFRSAGRHIPAYRSINPTTPIRFLADGRPVFGPARRDPRFSLIQIAESGGVSQYDALTIQLAQRWSRGFQISANYTLSRAVDDASEQEVTYSDGLRNQRAMADPANRAFDRGYSFSDQRHTFVMSMVAGPRFELKHKAIRYLINNNQVGVIARAKSGERFNIMAGRLVNNTLNRLDLNGDGLDFPDRPVGVKRNSGVTPPQFNLDLRYSRNFYFLERFRFEIFCDIQNLFNINSIVAYNNVIVPTDPVTGQMIGELPDFKARNSSVSLESRQAQIGIKFYF